MFHEADEERCFRLQTMQDRYAYHAEDERVRSMAVARPTVEGQPAEPMPKDQPAEGGK